MAGLPIYGALACCWLAVGCGGSGTASRSEDPQTSSNAASPGGAPAAPGTADPASPNAEAPPGVNAGNLLIPTDGWVAQSSNDIGIQGAFFTYPDHSNVTTIAETPGESTTGYCVAGTAAQVMNMDFGGTFGATAALNLSQQPGSEAVGAYDAAAHGVLGFGFDITGSTGGALRFVTKQFGVHDGFCVNMVPECASDCSVEFRLDELHQNCWLPGGPLPDPQSLSALEWQITTNANAPVDFDFCIENLHAVLAEPTPL